MRKYIINIVVGLLLIGLGICIYSGIQANSAEEVKPQRSIQEIIEAFKNPDWEVRCDALDEITEFHPDIVNEKGCWPLKKEYDCKPIRDALITLFKDEFHGEGAPGEGYAEYYCGVVYTVVGLRDPRSFPEIMEVYGLTVALDCAAEIAGKKEVEKLLQDLNKGEEHEVNHALKIFVRMIGNKKALYKPTEKEKQRIGDAVETAILRFPPPKEGEIWYDVKMYRSSMTLYGIQIIGKLEDVRKIPLLKMISTSKEYKKYKGQRFGREQIEPLEEAKKVLAQLQQRKKK